MERSTIGRLLQHAAADEAFRNRAIENLGMALAQEGFLLTDAEMAQMRTWWSELEGMTPRGATDRIQALARANRY